MEKLKTELEELRSQRGKKGKRSSGKIEAGRKEVKMYRMIGIIYKRVEDRKSSENKRKKFHAGFLFNPEEEALRSRRSSGFSPKSS